MSSPESFTPESAENFSRVTSPEEAEHIARKSNEVRSEIADIRSGKKPGANEQYHNPDLIADLMQEAGSIENKAAFEYEYQHLPMEELQARIDITKKRLEQDEERGKKIPEYSWERLHTMELILDQRKFDSEKK